MSKIWFSRFLTFLCIWILSCEYTSNQQVPKVSVTIGDLNFIGNYRGELRPKKSLSLFAPEVGPKYLTVKKVVDDGKSVKKGELVLQFDQTEQLNELALAEGRLLRAVAKKELALEELYLEKLELEKKYQSEKFSWKISMVNLSRYTGIVAKLEQKAWKLKAEKAKFEVESAAKALQAYAAKEKSTIKFHDTTVIEFEKEVESAKKVLSALSVLAPADGIVFAPYTKLNQSYGKVDQGKVVRAGDKIIEIADLRNFVVDFFVRQKEVSYIKENAKIHIFPLITSKERFDATIVKVGDYPSTLNERLGFKVTGGNLKEYKVVLTMENSSEYFQPGGTVRVEVFSTIKQEVIKIPLAALIHKNEKIFVKDLKGKLVEIKNGATNLLEAEVISGLKPGMEIMLPNY